MEREMAMIEATADCGTRDDERQTQGLRQVFFSPLSFALLTDYLQLD
jgi:hypothetical protein